MARKKSKEDDFFQPFQEGDFWLCGGRTRRCKKCREKFSADDKSLTHCPHCGTDRRCRHKVAADAPIKRCKCHGGKSLSGAFLPQYKHGNYSQNLPDRLKSRFSEALASPDLLDLRQETALQVVRLRECLDRFHSGESGAIWKALAKSLEEYNFAWGQSDSIWHDFQMALAQRDMEAVNESLRKLDSNRKELKEHYNSIKSIVASGLKEEFVWREVLDTVQERQATVAASVNVLKAKGLMLSVEQATAMVVHISVAVRTAADRTRDQLVGELGMGVEDAERVRRKLIGEVNEKLTLFLNRGEGRGECGVNPGQIMDGNIAAAGTTAAGPDSALPQAEQG